MILEIPLWLCIVSFALSIVGFSFILALIINGFAKPYEWMDRIDQGQDEKIDLLTEIRDALKKKE